jgi:hypothetical protein
VNGKGPLAAPGFCSAIAHVFSANSSWVPNNFPTNSSSLFKDSTNESLADPRPDLQLHFLSYTPAMDFGLMTAPTINLQELCCKTMKAG